MHDIIRDHVTCLPKRGLTCVAVICYHYLLFSIDIKDLRCYFNPTWRCEQPALNNINSVERTEAKSGSADTPFVPVTYRNWMLTQIKRQASLPGNNSGLPTETYLALEMSQRPNRSMHSNFVSQERRSLW